MKLYNEKGGGNGGRPRPIYKISKKEYNYYIFKSVSIVTKITLSLCDINSRIPAFPLNSTSGDDDGVVAVVTASFRRFWLRVA